MNSKVVFEDIKTQKQYLWDDLEGAPVQVGAATGEVQAIAFPVKVSAGGTVVSRKTQKYRKVVAG